MKMLKIVHSGVPLLKTGSTRRRIPMSGNLVAYHSWSSAPMPDVFRYSRRPNRAHTINWRSWGTAAFTEAIQTHKPIFLVIASSWCEWSHVMDETTLSEPTLISIVNADYIPIRVDSDIRPDVNQRYNQNGWPSVALLSTEGEILWGGVYVKPQQLLYYLGHIRRYYSEHRQEISQQVHWLRERRLLSSQNTQQIRGLYLAQERFSLAQIPHRAGIVLRELFDAENGGFSIHANLKFPHPEALELLLWLAKLYQQPDMLAMVCHSLVQMRDGGLWDTEDGGFFRYSEAIDWSAPLTEKMLDENAALLRLTLLTAEMTGEEQWFVLARQLLRYVSTTLWQEDLGVFSGSQCADLTYYEPDLYSRASRQSPPIDTTIYTSWNARMISACLLAGRILHDTTFTMMALRALDYLCEHMLHVDGSAYHFSIDGISGLPGQLADQVWLTRALLDAYAETEKNEYLATAMALMQVACYQLLDDSSGLFYDYPFGTQAIGRLLLREQPLTENALAAECLLRIAAYTKRQNLRHAALLVLVRCKERYDRSGIQGAHYACIVTRSLEQKWL
jgi:uncharacterized protein YyaL (SSP411 family)